MEFEYIAGRYYENSRSFKAIGGFPTLKAAQSYVEMIEYDFLVSSYGFLFVSTPEGIYIHGEQNETSNHFVWFSPEEVKQDKVFLHSARADTNICIDGYMPYDVYKKIQQGNVFSVAPLEAGRTSILEKLENNKSQIKDGTNDQKDTERSWDQMLRDDR
ncbi:MAG: hypothetical protein HDP34_00885 [Clostridia bacterium]|nr:hypothetical protein [Clostridia bacterium]